MEIVRCVTLLLAAASTYDLMRDRRWRGRVLDAIAVSGFLVAVLGIGQYAGLLSGLFPVYPSYTQRVYSVFGNQDLFGGYLAVVLAVSLMRLSGRPRWFSVRLFAIGCVCLGLLLSASRTAWLAAAAGCLVTLYHVRWSRVRWLTVLGVIGVVVATGVLLAPQATLHRIATTFHAEDHGGRLRLWFWDGAVRMIRDHPVAGVGPTNFAYWSPRYLGAALRAPGGGGYDHNELLVDHPHSEPLGLFAEYGALGVVCGVWMLVRLIRCGGGAEWGGLTALIVFSLFNAPFHSAPHALAGLVLASALLGRRFSATRTRSGWLYGLAAAGCTVFFAGAVLLPSVWLRSAEDEHLARRPPFAQYERCTLYAWPNATAQLKYGIALLEAGRYSEARRAFTDAMKGTDTGEVYLALALLEWRTGAPVPARAWLDECLWRWPSSRDAWFLLALSSTGEEREGVYRQAELWLTPDALNRIKTDLAGR
ncbi:MAG: O-antigen ligase family protein, partial [Candidatus Hydrogenedentes bacterium]|nr:O-antigen ligase family protein [Candidatus Hydrogenedentota bacterium]